MKRKLSTLERLIDGNITYLVSLEGSLTLERLRSALTRVQRKHPALRMLISEENGELFYEMDAAREIPLRVVERVSDDDRARECRTEVTTAFAHGQPQLRVVWLRQPDESSAANSDLLFTTTHRICDGMSVLTIVRESLRALYSDDELIPYPAITTQDIIGDFRDKHLWKRKLTARLVNALFALIPSSRRPLDNSEINLEWGASPALSSALKQRCKAENVSIHATLLMLLSQALESKLGRQMPEWIESPMDARRGRLSALKSDMLFFGGGSFKVKAKQNSERDFWTVAREMDQEMRRKIDQDMLAIPGKYQFCEMLKPPSAGKIRSIVRLGDGLSRNGNWNQFSFSNLGNVVLSDEGAPFRVKSLRIYVHSFAIRILGLIAYALHGQLRFIYIGDEKCLSHAQADALRREFMVLLEKHLGVNAQVTVAARALDATAG